MVINSDIIMVLPLNECDANGYTIAHAEWHKHRDKLIKLIQVTTCN